LNAKEDNENNVTHIAINPIAQGLIGTKYNIVNGKNVYTNQNKENMVAGINHVLNIFFRINALHSINKLNIIANIFSNISKTKTFYFSSSIRIMRLHTS